MLRLVNINSSYGLVNVLKNVSLHVDRGEIVTLIGANGAGKTTTLRSISGLQPVKEGQIFLTAKIFQISARKNQSGSALPMFLKGGRYSDR